MSEKITCITNIKQYYIKKKTKLSPQTCFIDLSGSLSQMKTHHTVKGHSSHLFFSLFFFIASLLNFPDGDFAVSPGGAAQDIAVLGRAQCLDAVCVSLKLLGDSVALWVHHQQLASLLTATPSSGAASATAAHPDLI